MTRRGLLLFISMCVIWGIPYLFIRLAVSQLTPATLVFLRTAIAAFVLVPIAVSRGGLRPALDRWLPLIAFAAVEIGIPWLMLSSAEQRISSSLTGLLISAVPLVAAVIAVVLRSSARLAPSGILGLLIGVVGVAAIVGFDVRGTDALALGQIALVVVGYALGPAILAGYLSDVPSVSVMAVSLALCAVAYAPVAVLQWPAFMPSGSVLVSVAVLAVVCTALAFVLFLALIAEVGPVRATVITYINPAVAALLGVVVLRETFRVGMGVGFVLVLLGSVLATGRAPRIRSRRVLRRD